MRERDNVFDFTVVDVYCNRHRREHDSVAPYQFERQEQRQTRLIEEYKNN